MSLDFENEAADAEEEGQLINFFSEEIDFDVPDEAYLPHWIEQVLSREGKTLTGINYVFTGDAYLHRMNVEYLNHDTLTDIITFPYSEGSEIQGDIFISIDRIRENAVQFGVAFEEELRRVMAHGALHLCGYLDKTAEEKKLMSAKEDEALLLWQEMHT